MKFFTCRNAFLIRQGFLTEESAVVILVDDNPFVVMPS